MPAAKKKLTMEELIAKADAAKKSNPLDLSSDQDLSIAIMNLVSLEEHFFFSGGKTGKTGFYDLVNVVREMRKELMDKLIQKSTAETGEVWCISKHLLAASMRLMEVGTKALGHGKKAEAYNLFSKAYDLYSLFWGINMGLVDLNGVKKDESIPKPLREWMGTACDSGCETHDTKSEIRNPKPDNGSRVTDLGSRKEGLLSGLGAWVKKSVNCCLE